MHITKPTWRRVAHSTQVGVSVVELSADAIATRVFNVESQLVGRVVIGRSQ